MVDGRPGSSLPPMDFPAMKQTLTEDHGPRITDYDVLSSAMYPKVSQEAGRWQDYSSMS